MYDQIKNSITDKEAADGPQTISLEGSEYMTRHQVTIEVPSTPSAGYLKIEMRQSGASVFMEIEGSPVLLTGLSQDISKILTIEALVGTLRFTPTQTLDTTYSVYVHSVR